MASSLALPESDPGKQPFSLTSDKLLIVEGHDEELLLPRLREHAGIGDVQVAGIGGKRALRLGLRQVRLEMDHADLVSLGVLRDADDNPKGEFDSVCSALKANGFEVPTAPGALTDGVPRVGVFILPDAATKGALETLCLRSVGDEPALVCTDAYFECIGLAPEGTTAGQFAHARAQVYLASRYEEVSQAGLAACKGCWDFDSPVWDGLKDFLRQL